MKLVGFACALRDTCMRVASMFWNESSYSLHLVARAEGVSAYMNTI